MLIPFNILSLAHPTQWLSMTVVAGVGTVISTALTLNTSLTSAAVTVISSVGVGVAGGLNSRWTNHPPLIDVLSGVGMLVPGGLGARGAAESLAKGGNAGGIDFGATMLLVGLQISIGVFVAEVLVPSRGDRRTTRITLI